jgi:predicted membrane protein (TIGR00267 family)
VSSTRQATPKSWLRGRFDLLRRYHEVSGVGEIVRRYFAMNAFDGVLTTLGVLAGGYFGGVRDGHAIVVLGLSTAAAMGISGSYGAYMTERAERRRALHELEESTLFSLKNTGIAAASRYATIVIAAVDGLSPVAAAIVAILPFFFLSAHDAYYVGAAVAFVELFLLGVFLGRVSRERLVWAGAKLMGAGVVSLVVSLLLKEGFGR